MQMRMTYLSAEHKDHSPGSASDAFDPDAGVITTELNSKAYNDHLNDMAAKGWQLISVQPIHRVEYTHIQNISVIGGFYFFWQKSGNNTADLAFPMTSDKFPGLPAITPATQTVHKAVPAKQKPQAAPTRASSDMSFCETEISSYETDFIDSTDNRSKSQEPTREPAPEPTKVAAVETRVSKIKKLLAEKSSNKPNAKPPTINIPAEANTQLLRNLEDFHDLKKTAKSRKARPEEKPRSTASRPTPKPDLNTDTDDHLDLDLDFDF